MKVSEALIVLNLLDPDQEVTLTFGKSVKPPKDPWPPVNVPSPPWVPNYTLTCQTMQ